MKQKDRLILFMIFIAVPALCWEGGCGKGEGGNEDGSTDGAVDPYDAARQRCVDRINELRDSVGLPPYERWTAGESCADGEAESDSETGEYHGAFGSCGESAQNECPGWGSVESIYTGCLDMMWAEGPGTDFSQHGHYINMTSTSYTRVACGFYVTGGGAVWSVQNFR